VAPGFCPCFTTPGGFRRLDRRHPGQPDPALFVLSGPSVVAAVRSARVGPAAGVLTGTSVPASCVSTPPLALPDHGCPCIAVRRNGPPRPGTPSAVGRSHRLRPLTRVGSEGLTVGFQTSRGRNWLPNASPCGEAAGGEPDHSVHRHAGHSSRHVIFGSRHRADRFGSATSPRGYVPVHAGPSPHPSSDGSLAPA
jgi:hypothetical protein